MRKNPTEKLMASILAMKSEFNQPYRKEIQMLEASEKLFIQSVQKKNKEEAYNQAYIYAKSNYRLIGYDKVLESINIVKDNLKEISTSKTIPDQFKSALQVLYVYADILKTASFLNFRNSVLKDLFGQAGIQLMNDASAMTTNISQYFAEKSFDTKELNDSMISIANKRLKGDLRQIEFIIGPQHTPTPPSSVSAVPSQPPILYPQPPQQKQQQPPQPPQSTNPIQYSQPPQQPPQSTHSIQNLKPPQQHSQQPPQSNHPIQYDQPSTTYNVPQQQQQQQQQQPPIAPIIYPSVQPAFLPSQQQQQQQQPQSEKPKPRLKARFNTASKTIAAMGETVAYQSKNTFVAHPELCHPVSVPVFSREMWPRLSSIINNAVA